MQTQIGQNQPIEKAIELLTDSLGGDRVLGQRLWSITKTLEVPLNRGLSDEDGQRVKKNIDMLRQSMLSGEGKSDIRKKVEFEIDKLFTHLEPGSFVALTANISASADIYREGASEGVTALYRAHPWLIIIKLLEACNIDNTK